MNMLIKETEASRDMALLIVRLIFGFAVFYAHGMGKLSVIIGPDEIQFFDPIGIGAKLSFILAGIAEGICGILIILGLFMRLGTIILILNFIVIVVFHGIINKEGFGGYEMPLLYLATWVALFISGPGKLSLDYILFGRK